MSETSLKSTAFLPFLEELIFPGTASKALFWIECRTLVLHYEFVDIGWSKRAISIIILNSVLRRLYCLPFRFNPESNTQLLTSLGNSPLIRLLALFSTAFCPLSIVTIGCLCVPKLIDKLYLAQVHGMHGLSISAFYCPVFSSEEAPMLYWQVSVFIYAVHKNISTSDTGISGINGS